jgi:hypothetical protein
VLGCSGEHSITEAGRLSCKAVTAGNIPTVQVNNDVLSQRSEDGMRRLSVEKIEMKDGAAYSGCFTGELLYGDEIVCKSKHEELLFFVLILDLSAEILRLYVFDTGVGIYNTSDACISMCSDHCGMIHVVMTVFDDRCVIYHGTSEEGKPFRCDGLLYAKLSMKQISVYSLGVGLARPEHLRVDGENIIVSMPYNDHFKTGCNMRDYREGDVVSVVYGNEVLFNND